MAKLKTALSKWSTYEGGLERLAACAPGALYSYRLRPDSTASIPFASPSFEEVYGVRVEDVSEDASPAWAIMHPDDVPVTQAAIEESARTLNPWHHEFRLFHPEKGEIWIEADTIPRREPDGSVLWYGFMHDVTERKRAAQALAEAGARRRLLFEQSRDGIVVLDEDGKVYEANRRFADMLGYRDAEVRDCTCGIGTPIGPGKTSATASGLPPKTAS